MKPKWYLLLAGTIVACTVAATWSSAPVQGEHKTYEVQPQINLPAYGVDTVRAIDAYERLMDRYMGMTERVFTKIDNDAQDVSAKLDSIAYELTELTARIEGIEKALGITQAAMADDGRSPRPSNPSGKADKENPQGNRD